MQGAPKGKEAAVSPASPPPALALAQQDPWALPSSLFLTASEAHVKL